MIWGDEVDRPVVLLTAAVSPNVVGKLAVTDPATRLRQYRWAITEWSNLTSRLGFRLAIVETTGTDSETLLEGLNRDAANRVEVFSYHPTPRQLERGKGAVELAAIREVVDSCGLVAPRTTLYKCTGRLVLSNGEKILEPIQAEAVKIRMTLDRSWADSRLVGAPTQVWRDYILPGLHLVDDASGRYLERVLAARVAYANALDSVAVDRFASRPLFSGISGSTGTLYNVQAAKMKNLSLRWFETLLSDMAARKQV